jgi:transcription elongation factor GreA
MKSYVTTKEGLEKLKKELAELKGVRRPELSERISSAKDLGDLSENAEYHDAKDALAFLEGRIIEVEDFVAHAVVSDPASTDVITVGCKVTCEMDGKRKEYFIVGSNESDPAAGRISNESPLGRAFLGRKCGAEFEATLPAGMKKFKVLEIACE